MINRKLLIVSGVVLVILSAAWVVWLNVSFRVASVFPNPSSFPSSMPYVEVSFNHGLGSQNFDQVVNLSDNTKQSVEQKGAKTVRITLQNIVPNKVYTLSLTGVRDAGGKSLSKTMKLKVKYIPSDQLSDTVRNAILDAQSQSKSGVSDPILSKLPYSSLNYTLTPAYKVENGQQKLTIKAQILLDASDVNGDKQAAIDQYEQDAQSYLKSAGIDTTKYPVEYEVVEPSIF